MHVERIEHPDWEMFEHHPGAMVCHSRAWFSFLEETQQIEPVVLKIHDQSGESFFCGGIVRKFGLKILGSPFPGWTTSYMGFLGSVDRIVATTAVRDYAFRHLGVIQFECLDAGCSLEKVQQADWKHRVFQNFLLDLTLAETELHAGLARDAKYSLAKGRERGVVVTLNPPDDEFSKFYHEQMIDVFARQGLRPTYGLDRIKKLLKNLRPDNRVITGWSQDASGRVIATNISVGNGNRAYLWGAALNRSSIKLRPTELLQWEIILEWQRRGTKSFDFGGAGEYKRKYGGTRIETPFVRFSKYPALESLRNWGQQLQKWRQRRPVQVEKEDTELDAES